MKKFTEKDFLKLQHAEADRRWGKGGRVYQNEWHKLSQDVKAIVAYLHANGFIDAMLED